MWALHPSSIVLNVGSLVLFKSLLGHMKGGAMLPQDTSDLLSSGMSGPARGSAGTDSKAAKMT